MELTPDTKPLSTLIEGARDGTVVLPQFQREFVWGRDDVTDLVVSVLKGYFIGSFLMIRADQESSPFAIRPLQGVNLTLKELQPEWMVLDGQQRLTSLHYVFAAPNIPLRGTKNPYRFFLDLKKILSDDIDGAVTTKRADWCAEDLKRDNQFRTLVIPFTEVENWNDWINAYETWLLKRDQDHYLGEYFNKQRPVWNRIINNLQQFRVPLITLPKVPKDDADRIGEVCAIFEKMNSTGVQLSVYDLLTARLYKNDIDVHSLWRESLDKHNRLAEFSDGEPDNYGIYILRVIALMRGIEVKSKMLVNLSPLNFKQDWNIAAAYIEKALQRITSTNSDGFGAFTPKWAPYSTMVSTLAALLHFIETQKVGHHAYQYIRTWYWGSVFLERYAGAVETAITRDYRELIQAFMNPEYKASVFTEVDTRIISGNYSLLGVSRINSIYKGVMDLVAICGAKDFRANDSIEFHTLNDHHIFPRAYLNKFKTSEGKRLYNDDEINSVVNRTLILESTNQQISNTAPADYLERFVPEVQRASLLRTHFINNEALAAMQANDYDGFRLHREQALLSELRRQLTIS